LPLVHELREASMSERKNSRFIVGMYFYDVWSEQSVFAQVAVLESEEVKHAVQPYAA